LIVCWTGVVDSRVSPGPHGVMDWVSVPEWVGTFVLTMILCFRVNVIGMVYVLTGGGVGVAGADGVVVGVVGVTGLGAVGAGAVALGTMGAGAVVLGVAGALADVVGDDGCGTACVVALGVVVLGVVVVVSLSAAAFALDGLSCEVMRIAPNRIAMITPTMTSGMFFMVPLDDGVPGWT
jgi:hypothetical protein